MKVLMSGDEIKRINFCCNTMKNIYTQAAYLDWMTEENKLILVMEKVSEFKVHATEVCPFCRAMLERHNI